MTIGGIIPIWQQIKYFRIDQLITEFLGERPKQAKYGINDAFIGLFLSLFCGGKRILHINKFKDNLERIGVHVPSHDTIGRVLKKLATEVVTTEHIHDKKLTYRSINKHIPLNDLLLEATCKMGLLKPKVKYDLDMDATVINTDVRDAKVAYKGGRGFAPMVSSIGNLPIYIQMRNGNVSPLVLIKECLEETFDKLSEHNIQVGRVRMDAGSYDSKAMDYLHEKNLKFYIGVRTSKPMKQLIKNHEKWQKTTVVTSSTKWKCETARIPYKLTGSKNMYSLVVLRMKTEDYKHRKWIKQDGYSYKIIITNDNLHSGKKIMEFYNGRGDSEQNFSMLKGDFAWRLPPFSKMNENTVYLFATALASNIYQGIIHTWFKHKHMDVRLNAKLESFRSTFIFAVCKIVNGFFEYEENEIDYISLLEKIC